MPQKIRTITTDVLLIAAMGGGNDLGQYYDPTKFENFNPLFSTGENVNLGGIAITSGGDVVQKFNNKSEAKKVNITLPFLVTPQAGIKLYEIFAGRSGVSLFTSPINQASMASDPKIDGLLIFELFGFAGISPITVKLTNIMITAGVTATFGTPKGDGSDGVSFEVAIEGFRG